MRNYTAGPWIAKSDEGRYNNSRNTWRVDDEEAACSEAAPITLHDGTVIAFAVASDDDYFTDDRVDANARLIAAAPDLLDVARHCEQILTSYEINRIDGEEISDKALALIRAAIAKATAP